MENEQWEIDLRSQIDGVDEYQNMVDFIRPLIQQIRQDTIKEMESNLFLKDIVKQTRIDTLKKVLDIVSRPINKNAVRDCDCEIDIINLASGLWDIDLTNLN